MSDPTWQFLKTIKWNEHTKTTQTNSYGWNWRETTNFFGRNEQYKTSWIAILQALLATFKPFCNNFIYVVAGCENLFQKVESSSTFYNKICAYCPFYRTKVNLLYSEWRNSSVSRDFRVILSNSKSVFTQLATTGFVARQVWLFTGGKTRNIVIQLVLKEVAKQVARFCRRFYHSLRSRFFGISSKPRTSRGLVTKGLLLGLRFEVHFCMARPRSRGKWFTARVSAPQTSESQVWEEILLFRTLLLIN